MEELLARARRAYGERGAFYVMREGTKILHGGLCAVYYRSVRYGRSFTFSGEKYPYFYRRYNHTWDNERAVEVPIVWRIVKEHSGQILEVGNVLSHYFPCKHDVLDKYEKSSRVINCDVADFKPSRQYDLIVSISTLEHVGFDPPESPDPKKILRALDNLRHNCLKPGGEIVVTLPLGHNSEMDQLLYDGKLGFSTVYYLKRVSKENIWIQTEMVKVMNSTYGYPFPGANAIVLAREQIPRLGEVTEMGSVQGITRTEQMLAA